MSEVVVVTISSTESLAVAASRRKSSRNSLNSARSLQFCLVHSCCLQTYTNSFSYLVD